MNEWKIATFFTHITSLSFSVWIVQFSNKYVQILAHKQKYMTTFFKFFFNS